MEDLEAKLIKAKIELMTKSAFISTIALSARHTITEKTATADVCGISIRYNPTFIQNQSVAQLAGLIAHECWHMAFQHAPRRGSRDPIIWNVAGDYVINNMLVKGGFQIPPEGLLDDKYDESWSTDKVYEDLIEMGAEPNPSTFMRDLLDEDGAEDGVKLDSEVTNVIVRARTQAQISDKDSIGDIPGEILRIIDELLDPKLPWPIILNKFLDQRVQEEYSWARRNRRFQSTYLPSMHSYGLGHLTFAIDTSGSIGEKELQSMLSEIKGIRDVFNPEKMTIIDCDSQIHGVHEVTQNTDIMSLKFHGGGGTSFLPVLEYVTEHPTQALVYFTDLYGESDLEKVDYPILWICTSEHAPMDIGETVYANYKKGN